MKSNLTHNDLVARGHRWLRKTIRCRFAVPELVTYAPEQPDVVGCHGTRGFIVVECKRTRGDYWKEKQKPHIANGWAMGNERWFLTPAGLIAPDEVLDGHGLAEVHGRGVRVIVPAPRRECDPSLLILRLQHQQTFLNSVVGRIADGGDNRENALRRLQGTWIPKRHLAEA